MIDKNFEFSNYLKELRISRKMTLVELAEKAGTSNSYLSQLENMRRNPPKPEMLKNIANALGNNDELEAKDIYRNLMKKAGYVDPVIELTKDSKLFKEILAKVEADRTIELDKLYHYNPDDPLAFKFSLNNETLDDYEISALQLLLKGILADRLD